MAAYLLAEGLVLSAYQFLKYKADAKKTANSLTDIGFEKQSITLKDLKQLQAVCEAVYLTRTLVNEPLSYLTAEQLAKDITAIGKEGGFRVNVLGKAKIEQMNMGGLLAVNRGSMLPPTFTIMEHRPAKAINKAPIVLVGKGIVYDTGGLSLKPTANSMDRMKSDMSGAALVTGVMYVAAQLDLPLHIVALVPATDNRPGENAYVPGDVITMYSGTTVEVLNTDAEGRLVLGDALH
ncbi:MAG: peptidase M17, partial [Sphingobacteriales bacterium]